MRMASAMSESSPIQSRYIRIKEEPGRNCNGEPEHFLHPMNDSDESVHAKDNEGYDNARGVVAFVCNPPSDVSPSQPKAVKVATLENNDAARKEVDSYHGHETAGESVGRHPQAHDSTHEVKEPVSLSKTSSLIREVQQLGEDRDLCLQGSIPNNNAGADVNEQDTHETGGTEAITYHVLDNSTIVKFEPRRQQTSTKGDAAEVDGFDGHTITLVEDENNAGTFKIAELGEDNTLRVIDNDRIVVFQDESTINQLCKANGNLDKSKAHDGDSSRACLSQSMHGLQNNITAPGAYPGSKTGLPNNESAHEEDREVRLGRSEESSPPHSYMNEYNSERGQVVQTYADTSIMKPLQAEPGQHVGTQQHHRTGNSSFSDARNPGPTNPQAQSWHYTSEREASAASLPPQYKVSEAPYPNLGSCSGQGLISAQQQAYPEYGAKSTSNAVTSQGSYGESGAGFPGYSPHPMTTWAPTGDASSGQADSSIFPHPLAEGSQKTRGTEHGHVHAGTYPPPPSAYMPAAAAANYMGYSGDVGRSWRPAAKMNDGGADFHGNRDSVGYHHHHHPPHPHPHHPAQQQQQHPPPPPPPGTHPVHAPPVVPVARPYPVYPPGWEGGPAPPPPPPPAHPSQRHLRFMTTAAIRERTGGAPRFHSADGSRVNTPILGQAAPSPLINVGAMATRCPPTVPINAAPVGRPRKRSASQVEAASKGSFQETGTTTTMFTGNSSTSSNTTTTTLKEPVKKRPRDQQTTVSITNLGALTSNVHTLKPGHIIAWYIDYLIHENEDRTQISRAYTLPVNLFHTDDFYFLDSLRKRIRFPSPKFLAWMQYHLPSLNANAIDFREGRPSREGSSLQSGGGGGQWSQQQDWGWQNKTKRDIIHDVFFYFQHRKAASTEPHQFVSPGTRSKAQLVA